MDPVANFLTQIRNASSAGIETVTVRYSKIRHAIALILEREGYVDSVSLNEITPDHKELTVVLGYTKTSGSLKAPKISTLRRISTPGRRVYVGRNEIPRPLRGMGTIIISTSHGLVTGKEANKRGLGGEIVCEVW